MTGMLLALSLTKHDMVTYFESKKGKRTPANDGVALQSEKDAAMCEQRCQKEEKS